MTAEKRLVFDTSDVLTIICQCNECGGRLGVPSGQTVGPGALMECPYCKATWTGEKYEHQAREYIAFMYALQDVNVAHDKQSPGFFFRLEFDDPSLHDPGFGPRRLYGEDRSSSRPSCLTCLGSGQLGVGEVLADDGFGDFNKAAPVVLAASVEPERLLVEVAEDMERLNGHVGPVNGPLHQGPEVLNPVRVDAAPHVLHGVVNDVMQVVGLEPVVTPVPVGVEAGPRLDVGVAPIEWTPNLLREKGVHSAKNETTVRAGVPASNG